MNPSAPPPPPPSSAPESADDPQQGALSGGSPPEAKRRLGLLDALILVCSLAVGFGLTRYQTILGEDDFGPKFLFDRTSFDRAHPIESGAVLVYWALSWATTSVACLAAGLLVVRLRRPRPGLRDTFRLAGTSACLATLVGLAYVAGLNALNWMAFQFRETQYMTFGMTKVAMGWAGEGNWFDPHAVAGIVVAWWLGLSIGSGFRRESSTIDRLGRAVGLFWIAWALIDTGLRR